ncbi:MAG: multiple sugar transport system permease protein [Granulosicoccus sp.]|jgi:multiple sugar transport system permease protein
MSDKARTQRNNFFIDVTLFLICFLLLLPLILLISNAFKTPAEILSWPPSIFPKDPTLENFRKVFTETPLLRWIFNSLAFAVLSTIAIVATSALAGYVVAKFPFRSINIIFVLFLATAIIPFEVYMIPLYFQVKALGALNSIGGLLIGYLVMSFGIFLIRQNVIASIPDDLLEAARIDGAGEFWIFGHIVLPLLKGPLAALAVLAFFQAWTTFAWPIIVMTRKSAFTIEVGLANFQSAYTVELSLLSAASAAVMIPSVLAFVLLRRNFVEGIASSGMKE